MSDFFEDFADRRLSIRVAGNTGPRCLFVLRQKGYDIHLSYDKRGDECYPYYDARKAGRFFSCDSPEGLLGLVAMWEAKGDDWRATVDEDWTWYDELQEEAKVYDEDGDETEDD